MWKGERALTLKLCAMPYLRGGRSESPFLFFPFFRYARRRLRQRALHRRRLRARAARVDPLLQHGLPRGRRHGLLAHRRRTYEVGF